MRTTTTFKPLLPLLVFFILLILGFLITVVATKDTPPQQLPQDPTVVLTPSQTSSKASSKPLSALQVAESLKPLKNLHSGDKVLLWRPDKSKPRMCKFKDWSSWEIDFSNVVCEDGLQINVHTSYLTPVEFRKGH